MNSPDINKFVTSLMSINADYPGMGGASAAIIGASGTNGSIINDLRHNTILFASEYSKTDADRNRLEQLARQLEGSLLALKMINAISDERLNQLSADLEMLLKTRSN